MLIKKEKDQKKFLKLILGLGIVMVSLLVGEIILSNHLATDGKSLEQLEQKIEVLVAENKRLRTQKAEVVSLSELAVAAVEAGFVEDPSILSFPTDQTVALKPE